MSARTIALLEDDGDRVAEMKRVVDAEFGSRVRISHFVDAHEMVRWLSNGAQVALFCLDHDLEGDGVSRGRGTGRDVVEWLVVNNHSGQLAIVHSSNPLGASGMCARLEGAGWSVGRVIPEHDLEWVGTHWLKAVVAALAQTVSRRR